MTKLPAVPSARGLPTSDATHLATLGFEGERPSLLLTYWQMFVRWRWPIAAVVAGCVLLALVITFTTPREYAASARIQIDRASANVVQYEDLERDGYNNWEFYETQYELLQSRSLAQKVVADLSLDLDDEFLSSYDPDALEGLAELTSEERTEMATDMVMGGTQIMPVTGSSVVDIAYRGRDPEMVAKIANSLAESFIDQNLERRFEASVYARDFLKERLDAMRERLEESEREAAEYARREGIVLTSSSSDANQRETLTSERLSKLSAELAAATAARVQAESDFRNDSGGRAAASSLDNATLTALRRQRGELRAELSKLESDFGPEYPAVRALQSQIAELEQQIENEAGMVRRSVASDLGDRYRQALAVETALRRQVDVAKSAVLDEQQNEIGFNILEREVATNRELYEGLLQRYKEVGVASGVGTNNISIVDEAMVPYGPSSPSLFMNVALALIVGLALAGGGVLLLEQISNSRVRPSDLQAKIGLPLLGSTPRLGRKDDGDGAQEDIGSELSEAYFSTMTSIQFSTEEGAPATIFVTSTQPNEGKTTSALALARDLASIGAKVLLLDCDLRKPSVHRSFSKPLGHGTSDYLAGREQLADIVVGSGEENLSFVSAGTPPPNPAELLSGQRLAALIADARATFDHVIIDGPPVLGLADAPLISRHADGTVFVIESQRTAAARARNAVERLLMAQARLIGAIVTKYDERTGGYGYGYGYGYGAQYRYGK